MDQSHWVEYGTEEMKTEDFGTLSFPKKILIGRFTDDPHGQDYEFPGLPGLNCFFGPRRSWKKAVLNMPVPAAWRALILKWAMRRSPSAERSTLDRPLDDRNWNTNRV